MLGWKQRAELTHDAARFVWCEAGRRPFWGPRWHAHLRGWKRSCARLSRRVFSFGDVSVADFFELGVLDLIRASSHRFAEQGSAPLDLVQAGIATAFRNSSQSVKSLDHFHLLDHRFCDERIHTRARSSKNLIDQNDGGWFAPPIFLDQFFRFPRLCLVGDLLCVRSNPGEDLINSVYCIWLILGILFGQSLSKLNVAFFQKFADLYIIFLVLRVVQISNQALFQCFKSERLDETAF